MSLRENEDRRVTRRFPRVSGDEPGISRDEEGDLPFSPRERG